MAAPTPQEILDGLDDKNDDECLYIDAAGTDDCYIWRDPDDEDSYTVLQRSTSGSWFPHGKPVTTQWLKDYLDSIGDDTTVEVHDQTNLPPGRHPIDQ